MSESVIFNPAEEFAGYRIKIDIDGERCSYEIVKYGDESFSLCSTKDYPGVPVHDKKSFIPHPP